MGLTLAALNGPVDADPSVVDQSAALLTRNAERIHLAPDELAWTKAPHAWALTRGADTIAKFAIVVDGSVIGRVDLNPVDPPRYTIGYWVDAASTGQGYATRAVTLAVRHARLTLGASDIYAGVTKGNGASVRVLERNNFSRVADLGRYERFHLPLDGGLPRNPEQGGG